MRAGQPPCLDRDRPNLGEATPIWSTAVVQDVVPEDLLLETIEEPRHFCTPSRLLLGNTFDHLFLQPIDRAVALQLRLGRDIECRAKLTGVLLLQFLEKFFVDRRGLERTLGDLQRLEHRPLELAEFADLSVREHEGLDHDALAHLLGPGLDHDDRFFTSCDHQVERRIAELIVRWIDDVDPLDQAHPHPGNRVMKGNVREVECRRGARDRQNVWIVFVICRDDHRDDLRLVLVPVREEGTDRAICQPTSQDLLLGGTSLPLEISSRDSPCRISILSVVDGQREEIDSRLRSARRDGGHQHDRLPLSHQDRSIRLLGDASCLDGQVAPAKIDPLFQKHLWSPVCASTQLRSSSALTVSHLSKRSAPLPPTKPSVRRGKNEKATPKQARP